LRRTHEAGYKLIARLLIQILRRVNLLNKAILHNHDSIAHGHSFGLVVSYIDKGGTQSLMQLGDLSSHLGTQLSIQVGKRFVQKEYLRITNDSTAQGDTLSLTTGQSLRLTIQQVRDIQDSGSLFHAALDFILRSLAELQTERHVIIHGHMRIQSVVLEHHCDITVLRSDIVGQDVSYVELALADFFQTGDHTQSSGLTAAGRTYQNDKLFVFNL